MTIPSNYSEHNKTVNYLTFEEGGGYSGVLLNISHDWGGHATYSILVGDTEYYLPRNVQLAKKLANIPFGSKVYVELEGKTVTAEGRPLNLWVVARPDGDVAVVASRDPEGLAGVGEVADEPKLPF